MIDAFIRYLKEQVENHSIYVWGGQGQKGDTITAKWIRERETSKKNADRVIRYWEKQVRDGYGDRLRAFDCSGLGSFFFLEKHLIPHDMTANGLMGQCTMIQKEELRPGDLVFRCNDKGRAYHVGYVIDDGKHVIEAQGRDVGVRENELKGWNRFGRPNFFEEKKSRLLKYKKPMMRGEDVTELQKALDAHGFSPGKIDGIFGRKTERAVKRFQKSVGLKTDGIAGPDTFGTLGLSYYG